MWPVRRIGRNLPRGSSGSYGVICYWRVGTRARERLGWSIPGEGVHGFGISNLKFYL